MTDSILSKARNAGYREGLSQAGMANYDDAYHQGQQDAWLDAPSRLLWFLIGFVSSLILMWWIL